MKRGDGLSKDDSIVATRNNLVVSERRGSNPLAVVLALIWFVGFSIWFYSFDLPNNHVARWAFWKEAPYDLLDIVDPPVVVGASPWSWTFLTQRIPFLLIAIAIWSGSWGIGSRVIRGLNLRLSACEQFFFATSVGLSCFSLIMLLLGLCGCMSRWLLATTLAVGVLSELIGSRRQRETNQTPASSLGRRFCLPSLSRFGWIVVIVSSPFVIGLLLGAMSPQTDFDVTEYHLGGPKEWFQQGQISRLPHNVYTNFPFLTEMLTLAGMVLYGDWQWGALAGQATIAGFAPLTAIGLFAAGRHWFSEAIGGMASLIYLTSPWTYRISIIAYAEGGLACYLFAALFAALLCRDQILNGSPDAVGRTSLFATLAGLLSGSAMACKYPGLISAVLPIGILLIWTAARHIKIHTILRTAMVTTLFSLGVGISIGPWLLKNAVETGNPVYPLAVRIFGGADRDEELDTKWRNGHAATFGKMSWPERLNDLPVKLRDVMATNDWHSPLMFGLAPLSVFWLRRRRKSASADQSERPNRSAIVGIVWLYVAWQFFTWWTLTHQIDRFYVPMFSAVSLLAAVGARWPESSPAKSSSARSDWIWNSCSGILIATSVFFYNFSVMLHIGGFNAGRLDLKAAENLAVSPRLKWINDEYESGRLPAKSKVLCVGEAQLFHARYPYLYNTVFDHSIFERLCVVPNSLDRQLRPADQIRAEFRKYEITHVDVNWSEILRYREPGSYGYTTFVNPDRFAELQRLGVLGPSLNLPLEVSMAPLSPERTKELTEWGPSLMTTIAGKPAYVTGQIFPVIDAGTPPR